MEGEVTETPEDLVELRTKGIRAFLGRWSLREKQNKTRFVNKMAKI